jgi:CRP-like cAMP-binding protein
MKSLIGFLDSIRPMSEGLKMKLYEKLIREEFKKKHKLLRVGQKCERIYFVEKGLFRCYVRRGGEESCKWFMREGDVVISTVSFFKQVPSKETIEALEDCIVYSITFEELDALYRDFPEFLWFGKRLTEDYYCRFEETADNLRMKYIKELYSDWRINHPELAGRVTDTHLASYLGTTLSTLSRAKTGKEDEKYNGKDVSKV